MKKSCTFIFLVVFLILLSGCMQAPKQTVFSDDLAMASYMEDTMWECATDYGNGMSHYKLCVFGAENRVLFDIYYSSEMDLTRAFEEMLWEQEVQNGPISYTDVYDFLGQFPDVDGLSFTSQALTYQASSNEILETNGDAWTFQSDGLLQYQQELYRKIDDLLILDYSFDQAVQRLEQQRKDVFLGQYPNLLTPEDTKYDPYGTLGQNFAITGTAELDDYYNYEYRDLQAVYYCICITPEGGSFTDRWYIYANRSSFPELFEHLKESREARLTLVCQTQFLDAATNAMATLVDWNLS